MKGMMRMAMSVVLVTVFAQPATIYSAEGSGSTLTGRSQPAFALHGRLWDGNTNLPIIDGYVFALNSSGAAIRQAVPSEKAGVLSLLGAIAREANRVTGDQEATSLAERLLQQIRNAPQEADRGIQKQESGNEGKGKPAGEAPKTFTNSIGMEFVLIPAGEFMMGSESGANEEKPVHKVRITKAFYMGKYEVTQAQWKAVIAGSNPSRFQGDDLPVERVTWDDCQAFLQRLSAKEGRTYCLPTEAEWEYVCRALPAPSDARQAGGTTTVYSCGDATVLLGEYAWFKENSGNKTHPVGQKKPNGYGLYDMHGNVWEWCQDWFWFGNYAAGDAMDPSGPAFGTRRLLRGGSWRDDPGYLRSAYRLRYDPTERRSYFGFRAAARFFRNCLPPQAG